MVHPIPGIIPVAVLDQQIAHAQGLSIEVQAQMGGSAPRELVSKPLAHLGPRKLKVVVAEHHGETAPRPGQRTQRREHAIFFGQGRIGVLDGLNQLLEGFCGSFGEGRETLLALLGQEVDEVSVDDELRPARIGRVLAEQPSDETRQRHPRPGGHIWKPRDAPFGGAPPRCRSDTM